MKKPESLRIALTAALSELRGDPSRLAIWIEDGAVRSRQTGKHGFSFKYPLSVLLREVKTDIAIVTHAINRWLDANQPDQLAGGAGDSYKFETDILDNNLADILFTIDLCEHVGVMPQPDGSWSIEYLAEPNPLFTDYDFLSDNPLRDPFTGATVVMEPVAAPENAYQGNITRPVTVEQPPPSDGDVFDLGLTDW
jgi:hypothetical protein